MPVRHLVHRTREPATFTLKTMGRVAREAANSWTFREWAARLATRAAPRDYRGQLRELYRGILDRWRYVQEPGEWTHGTASSAIRHVLGTKYNAPGSHPLRVRLDAIPIAEKGWGDCDDVAALVAGGVLALGMIPAWRVARGTSGAHVSVIARTPKGEIVSIDPVGHPQHDFGWALPSNDVRLYSLDATEIGRNFGSVEETKMETTYLSGIESLAPVAATAPHYVATTSDDGDGPRFLALPYRAHRLLLRGVVLDGCPAIDEHGKEYEYDADRDLWIDRRLLDQSSLGELPEHLGGFRSRMRRRRERRRARRRKRRARRRRFFKRVLAPARRLVAKALKSKWVQRAVGAALQSVGMPRRATSAVLAASGHIIERGGVRRLVRLIRKNPKAAMRLVAAAGKEALKAGTRLFGVEHGSPVGYDLHQAGRVFPAAPVLGFAGVPGVYTYGEIEVAPTPTPGSYYRIQRGDTLLSVAGRAYGLGRGRERYQKSKWINQAEANAPLVDPKNADNLYKEGRISFRPKFSADAAEAAEGKPGRSYGVIWIPETRGDEPAPEPPPPAPAPIEPPPPEPPKPPPPKPVPLPPVPEEPDEPEPPEPDEPPAPEPPAPKPVKPVEPVPAPEEPDHPEPPPTPAIDLPTGCPTEPVPPSFAAACRSSGGNPFWTSETGWGCVRGAPRCPEGFEPQFRRDCGDPEGVWTCRRALTPKRPPRPECPEGSIYNPLTNSCVPITAPEPEPVQPAPAPTPTPAKPVIPEIEEPTLPAPAPAPAPSPAAPADVSQIGKLLALLLLTGDL